MATTGLKVSKKLEDFIKFYDDVVNTYRFRQIKKLLM